MDPVVVKLEAKYEELEYATKSSYMYTSSLGKYENGFVVGEDRYGQEASLPLKLEPDECIDRENEDVIVENIDNTDAQRLALQKAKSLAASSFIYKVKKKHGKRDATDIVTYYHNYRLRGILVELLSQHKWKESTGVLSVLLKGSVKDNYFFRHQRKYWAALEVLRQIEGVEASAMRFKRIYGIFRSKLPLPKHAINKKLNPGVQLELALHLINQGDYQGAHEATKILVQLPQFRDDPVANMVHGLILHQQWHDSVVEELKFRHHDVNALPESMEIDSLETSNESSESVGISDLHFPRESSRNKDVMLLDSDSSIGNAKELPKEAGEHTSKKRCHGSSGHGVLKHHVKGFYEGSEEGVSSDDEDGISKAGMVLCSSGLDRRLFPIQLPRTQEHGKYIIPTQSNNVRGFRLDALKHFRVALSSSPPILAALLPYLQLLLANGQVKEALKEIGKFCKASNHLVPLSLKVRLLESISPQNPLLLARCYEEILQKNPASVHSIERLIKLHKKGDWKHMTYKAACACHILGPKFGYINDIYAALEREKEDKMLSILKSHIQHSLRLQEHLYRPMTNV